MLLKNCEQFTAWRNRKYFILQFILLNVGVPYILENMVYTQYASAKRNTQIQEWN
jgi:hypothetical protein